MDRKSNQPFKPSEFKGNRRERRFRARKMNQAFRLYMWEVELYCSNDYYYVIALNYDHVIEILQASEEQISEEQIYDVTSLNSEQMKLVSVDDNKTLLDLYQSYEGNGAVVCSTLW